MRGEGKRNFLGIVMGGCGRYVFFYVFYSFFLVVFLLDGIGGNGDGDGDWGMFCFRDGMECMMFDV